MTILPSQAGELELHIDIAWGADLSDTVLDWPWQAVNTSPEVDVNGTPVTELVSQTVSITRGRANETDQAQPATTSFSLLNLHGRYTPDRGASDLYPHVRRGTPCRVWVPGPTTYLAVDGATLNSVTTPDHASLDITGDIAFAVYGEDVNWWPSSAVGGSDEAYAISKGSGVAGQLSYIFGTFAGVPIVAWSTTGSDFLFLLADTAVPRRRRIAIAAELDVDNGAGGHTATFYWSADGIDGPWTQLGEPVDGVGTTSIHAGTAPLEVPARGVDGRLYAARVLSGDLSGTVVADPEFTAQTPDAASFVDSAGREWTVGGNAELTNRAVRFFGQIDEIAPYWPHGDLEGGAGDGLGDARVDINASGILRRLGAGQKALRSPIYRRVMDPTWADDLVAYWPMEDGSDATQGAAATPNTAPLLPGGDYSFARDDELDGALPMPTFASPAGWSAVVPATGSDTHWAVEWFWHIPVPGASAQPLMVVRASGTIRRWDVHISSANYRVLGYDANGVEVVNTANVVDPKFFAQWSYMRLEVEQNGSDVDWSIFEIPLDRSGLAYGFSGTKAGATCGRVTGLANLFATAHADYATGHFIVHDAIPLGWLALAETGFVGEAAAERMRRLCDEEGIPLAVIGELDDTPTMGPQRTAPLLELLEEGASTDLGILGERRDRLGLTYRTRASLYNQTPALALDAQADEIANPLAPVLDDQSLRNDVTVKRLDGSSAQVTDEDLVALEGRYDTEATVNLELDDDLLQQAGWRLHLGTWPGMRYRNLAAELTAAPRLLDDWPDVVEGDRVTVTGLPSQHPEADVDLIVQGYTEDISPGSWRADATCTPGGPWVVGVLDDDPDAASVEPDVSLARLDTEGCELDGAIDEDDTAVAVVTTSGPRWTTDADYCPFDVLVGGERMTVTAVAGAGLTQTFTVTRSANGVVKSHASGTAVQVADPFRLAL